MRKPAAFHTGNQWWRAAGFACWHLWSVRCCLRHQRLFFALVERLLVEFLALSSSAPLVYWLGCLCSLVALLVVLLLVRQRLVEHHRLSAGKLNAEKVKYVSARAQFREQQLLEPLFTEDELAVFKRGRNASKASVAKHASPEEYRASTGFECLLGWLYLNGQLERVHQLFEVLWQQFEPDQK